MKLQMAALLGAVVFAASSSACSEPLARDSQTTTPTLPSAPTPTVDVLEGSRPVRFPATDGVRLAGRIFGRGSTGVVLSHMGNPGNSQVDWWPLAARLSVLPVTVLTYDRRGVCPGGPEGCSRGSDDTTSAWKDVLGAVRFLQHRGATRVVAGGASLGAMATLYAATRGEIDALIIVAPVDLYGATWLTDVVGQVPGRKLFLSGRFDRQPAHDTRQLFRQARPPKELVLVNTGEHGTDILSYATPAAADAFQAALVDFVERVDSGGGAGG